MSRASGRAAKSAGSALLTPVRLVIIATPRTKKNHGRTVRVRGRPIHLASDAYREFEARSVPQLRQQIAAGGPAGFARSIGAPPSPFPIASPVSVQARFYRDALRGDLVGYMQAIADVLQAAGVLADDKWIVSWDGTRLDKDADRPRVEILIEPTKEY